jgi:hypothetical protein
MKAKILLLLFLGFYFVGFAQEVQRPGYGYRNEVDTSRHLINGFGINVLDFNGTANAVITADTAAMASSYDLTTGLALKINVADTSGNAAGNYIPRKQQTTALALKLNMADSTGAAAGNYVTNKYYTTNLPVITGKINTADSTGAAAGNYVTHKYLSTTYAAKASPTFTGVVTSPVVVVAGDTAGTTPGAIIYLNGNFWGRGTDHWLKLNPE